MTTKHLIQTVDSEKEKIVDDSRPLNKAIIETWKNSLNRIRTQLAINTDTQSIIDQLEQELTNYASCITELTEMGISQHHPSMNLLDGWGQSLRIIYEKMRIERRFAKALERMVEKIA